MTKKDAVKEQPMPDALMSYVQAVNAAIDDLAKALQGYAERDQGMIHPLSIALGVNAQEAKFDALFNLLIEKGVITRGEYNETVLNGITAHAEGLREETRKLAHRPIIAVKAVNRRQ